MFVLARLALLLVLAFTLVLPGVSAAERKDDRRRGDRVIITGSLIPQEKGAKSRAVRRATAKAKKKKKSQEAEPAGSSRVGRFTSEEVLAMESAE